MLYYYLNTLFFHSKKILLWRNLDNGVKVNITIKLCLAIPPSYYGGSCMLQLLEGPMSGRACSLVCPFSMTAMWLVYLQVSINKIDTRIRDHANRMSKKVWTCIQYACCACKRHLFLQCCVQRCQNKIIEQEWTCFRVRREVTLLLMFVTIRAMSLLSKVAYSGERQRVR